MPDPGHRNRNDSVGKALLAASRADAIHGLMLAIESILSVHRPIELGFSSRSNSQHPFYTPSSEH